jgi:hypothetical protein
METRMASEQQRIEAEREAERLRMEARMEAMDVVRADSWRCCGSTAATYAIRCTSTSSCNHSCEYGCFNAYVHA